MTEPEQGTTEAEQARPEADRRDFLKSCGKFAAITPPAVTFLLSTTMSSKAIAASVGRSRDKGSVGALLFGASAVPLGVAATRRPAPPAAAPAPQPVSAVLPVEAPAPLEIPPAPPPPVSTGERG